MYPFDYTKALYRRDVKGRPTVWFAKPKTFNTIEVFHGILGMTITHEVIKTNRAPTDDVRSRTAVKRKTGYKYLSEVKDNTIFPVEESLKYYLDSYLPHDRTTADGSLLPMLAKAYDNKDNRLFNNMPDPYLGQYKINGLRCLISATDKDTDIFKPFRLRFQSREGTYWDSLENLEVSLLGLFSDEVIDKMLNHNYVLDGELYIPGRDINEINSAVKNINNPDNKLVQYWLYDIAVDNMSFYTRSEFLDDEFAAELFICPNKKTHLEYSAPLAYLPSYYISDHKDAISRRNEFIDNGFEGLILRNPNVEYQYGKRNLSMIKFKSAEDGEFRIVDIVPEGDKRPDIPKFLLKNDINEATFYSRLGGSIEEQKSVLINKDSYIGKMMYVEYGERSGVTQVPFHIKTTYIV